LTSLLLFFTLFPYTTLFRSFCWLLFSRKKDICFSRPAGRLFPSEAAILTPHRSRSCLQPLDQARIGALGHHAFFVRNHVQRVDRSEEHTSELQSLRHLVCRL